MLIPLPTICEPFCGMLGVYQHIPSLFDEEGLANLKYLAGDTIFLSEYSAPKCFKRIYKNVNKSSSNRGRKTSGYEGLYLL